MPVWWGLVSGIDCVCHQSLHSPSLPAPSQPQNFTVVTAAPTAIMLSWQPPEVLNGVITGYFAWYTETLICNNSQVSNSSRMSLAATANTHNFTGLEEDTPYVFYVSAETSAGEGEAAMVMGRTLEDGECVCVCVFTCSHTSMSTGNGCKAGCDSTWICHFAHTLHSCPPLRSTLHTLSSVCCSNVHCQHYCH